MYSVAVRDHVMIAHSFRGQVFGPAQRMHGATYVVDTEWFAEQLDADGLVVDIGCARTALRSVLEDLDYQNLDELPLFRGKNTTTEFLAGVIGERLQGKLREGALGEHVSGIVKLRVTLRESHVAWASCELVLSPSLR